MFTPICHFSIVSVCLSVCLSASVCKSDLFQDFNQHQTVDEVHRKLQQ